MVIEITHKTAYVQGQKLNPSTINEVHNISGHDASLHNALSINANKLGGKTLSEIEAEIGEGGEGGNTIIHKYSPFVFGQIIMWHGKISEIPDGWLLCDGTHGTPNLTDKFIMCATTETEIGLEGGQTTLPHGQIEVDVSVQSHDAHTHAYSSVINHTHTVNITDNGHNHVITELRDSTSGSVTTNIAATADATSTLGTKVTGSRTTGITAATINPAEGVSSGTTDNPNAPLTHEVETSVSRLPSHIGVVPPFYKLAFIMYGGENITNMINLTINNQIPEDTSMTFADIEIDEDLCAEIVHQDTSYPLMIQARKDTMVQLEITNDTASPITFTIYINDFLGNELIRRILTVANGEAETMQFKASEAMKIKVYID